MKKSKDVFRQYAHAAEMAYVKYYAGYYTYDELFPSLWKYFYDNKLKYTILMEAIYSGILISETNTYTNYVAYLQNAALKRK